MQYLLQNFLLFIWKPTLTGHPVFFFVTSGSPTWRTPVLAQIWNLDNSRAATMGCEHGTLRNKKFLRDLLGLLFREVLLLFMPGSCTHEPHLQNETPQQRCTGWSLPEFRSEVHISGLPQLSTPAFGQVLSTHTHTHECDTVDSVHRHLWGLVDAK